MPTPAFQQKLLTWYHANKRDLPWRANRDPYRIWISETMLQQTTTTAVIPFFERFLDRFPTLQDLAHAPSEAVMEAWAGLGYYSRARNLHKAAKALNALPSFPQTYQELIELPGFGPYTARSVASLAFEQSAGVVDGNVIRVLSRWLAADWEWWQGRTRNTIQAEADAWVKGVSSRDMNQALMELGRTICTPRSPSCLLCPIRTGCQAFMKDGIAAYPQPKPRRAREIWHWHAQVRIKSGRILLGLNQTLPFLKGQWILPGIGERLKSAPKKFHYRHSITHHDIFVTVVGEAPKIEDKKSLGETKWIPLEELKQNVPVSLVHKALQKLNDLNDTERDGRVLKLEEKRTDRRADRGRAKRPQRSRSD